VLADQKRRAETSQEFECQAATASSGVVRRCDQAVLSS
jgi:hypothetical protein